MLPNLYSLTLIPPRVLFICWQISLDSLFVRFETHTLCHNSNLGYCICCVAAQFNFTLPVGPTPPSVLTWTKTKGRSVRHRLDPLGFLQIVTLLYAIKIKLS
jgi:hypothetical protein